MSSSQSQLWCMKVVIAHPDYKRPYAEVIIKHYSTKQAAEEQLMRLKKEFMPFDYVEDRFECTRPDYDDPIKFEEYFQQYCESYWRNQEDYMDQPAFDFDIFQPQLDQPSEDRSNKWSRAKVKSG